MNKQILNKILIVILLTVWSFVGYRFVSSFGLSKQADLSNTTAINPIPKVQSKRAAFRLGVINRDPFLNTFNRVETKSESPGRTVKSISEPKESRWPNIEYFGFVQNESSKNPLVLLKINNKIKRQ
jgi:hypothetical protein